MIVAEYLARCAEERDREWAVAEVGNIPIHTWKRDDSSIVVDSIQLKPTRWESSDDLLVFIIQGHNTQVPQAVWRGHWEVRPSLIKGLKAECTNGESVAAWIEGCLLDALRSNKR